MESIVPCSRVWKAITCILAWHMEIQITHMSLIVWSLFQPLKEIYVYVYMYIKHIFKIYYIIYTYMINPSVLASCVNKGRFSTLFHVKLGMLKQEQWQQNEFLDWLSPAYSQEQCNMYVYKSYKHDFLYVFFPVSGPQIPHNFCFHLQTQAEKVLSSTWINPLAKLVFTVFTWASRMIETSL